MAKILQGKIVIVTYSLEFSFQIHCIERGGVRWFVDDDICASISGQITNLVNAINYFLLIRTIH